MPKPNLKKVQALKDKLKAAKALKAESAAAFRKFSEELNAESAAAFREIADELKSARALHDGARCPRCPPRPELSDSLDAVAEHLESAASDLEG